VRMSGEALREVLQGVLRADRERPGLESGFALVGRIDHDESGRVMVINAVIDAGEAAEYSAGHVKFDRDHQQRELDLLRWVEPAASHLGDIHRHPGDMDHCSGGDYETDSQNVRASRTREMVFGIVTLGRYGRWMRIAESLYSLGAKIDFYYLGFASDYQYRKVQIEVSDEPMVRVPDEVRRIAESGLIDPLDWRCLRSLEGCAVGLSHVDLGEVSGTCVRVRGEDETQVLAFPGQGEGGRPVVFVDREGDLCQFEPAWLVEHWTPQVWLTPLVLEALRQARGQREPVEPALRIEPQPASGGQSNSRRSQI